MYGYFLLLPAAAPQIDSPICPKALMNMSSNCGVEKKNKYVMSMKLDRVVVMVMVLEGKSINLTRLGVFSTSFSSFNKINGIFRKSLQLRYRPALNWNSMFDSK